MFSLGKLKLGSNLFLSPLAGYTNLPFRLVIREIGGVDLRYPLTNRQIDEIRGALLKWRVVFFRGQELTHPEHIALAKQFGEPTPGHVIFGNHS